MTKPRLLREKYRTFSGAAKRAAFERGVAPSEYRAGFKSHVYSYRVVEHDGCYRVERSAPLPAERAL